MNEILEIKNISKSYNNHKVIEDFTLTLEKGKIGCLLGPSGCGKTTILRLIAGFEDITTGEIHINSHLVSSTKYKIPPEERGIGMVFQDYALFPHLSVKDNIAFGLKPGRNGNRQKQILELLEFVGLKDAADKYQHELSGGQQQRVALARALAPKPDLLLMDEPFSNLDVTLRERLSMEVRTILKELNISAMMVTHNQSEAFAMADDIGVICDGTLMQFGSAYSLYHRPANSLVADFVGEGVLLPGRVLNDQQIETGLGVLTGDFTHPCPEGCPVDVLIRPEDVVHQEEAQLKASVERLVFRGANILYTLRLDSGDRVLALVPSHCKHEKGSRLGIIPHVEDLILFERKTLN